MYKLFFAILFSVTLFLFHSVEGAEKTLFDAYTSFLSGKEECWKYFAPEFQQIQGEKKYTLPQVKERYKKVFPLLRLACALKEKQGEMEVLKALLAFMGQDPAMASQLPPEEVQKIKLLLPLLRSNLQKLEKAHSSLEFTELAKKEKSAEGNVSFFMDGKRNLHKVKLIQRNNKWLILEERRISPKQ